METKVSQESERSSMRSSPGPTKSQLSHSTRNANGVAAQAQDVFSQIGSRRSQEDIRLDRANPGKNLLKRKVELSTLKQDTARLLAQTFKNDDVFEAFDIEDEIKRTEKIEVKFLEGEEKTKYGRIAIKNRIKSFKIGARKTIDPDKYTQFKISVSQIDATFMKSKHP